MAKFWIKQPRQGGAPAAAAAAAAGSAPPLPLPLPPGLRTAAWAGAGPRGLLPDRPRLPHLAHNRPAHQLRHPAPAAPHYAPTAAEPPHRQERRPWRAPPR